MQDGVYLSLPHADYLAAPGRLGSTDITRLYARGAGWWWTSKNNPHHVDKREKPLTFGTALHALALEGPEAYAERFAVKPNPADYPELLSSTADLRSALEAVEAPGVKAKTPKPELVQLAKAYLPDRHIWDDIVERWSRTAHNKEHIDSVDDFALRAMYDAAMADDDMRLVLTAQGGVRLVEVSVFYTCARGLKKRYRFDSLLPTANVDLKSFADWRARPIEESIAARIRDDHLNVQLAMSHEARLAMYKLIEAGAIYWNQVPWSQATLIPEWLAQVAHLQKFPSRAPLKGADGPGWCWLWLFYQKPESGAAPALVPLRVLWGDDLHRSGWRKMRIAEETYLRNVERFGLSRPWTEVRGVYDTAHQAAQRLEVREWDAPMQQDGEQEAMSWQR